MRYYLLAATAVLVTGCSTVSVPVVQQNPYEFPPSLLQECRDPEFINPESKLSDVIKIMIENNTRSTECRIAKRALNEAIEMRKRLYDSTMPKQ